MNFSRIERIDHRYQKLSKGFECIDQSEGQYLRWYLSLMKRESGSVRYEEVEKLKSFEEHLLLCFACQNRLLDLDENV